MSRLENLNYFGDIRLKRMKFKSVVFLAIVNIFAFSTLLEAKDKHIKIEKMTQCLNSENLPIQIRTSEISTGFKKNRLTINSTVEVGKKINGMIQV